MKPRHAALIGLLLSGPSAGAAVPGSALDVVDAGLSAMGGAARLSTLSVEVDSIGHQFALEQSERPEGPWLVIYQQRTETRDPCRRRLLRVQSVRNWSTPSWSPHPPTVVVSDGVVAMRRTDRWTPGPPPVASEAEDLFDLAPERVLLTARSAADLRTLPDRRLHGVVNRGLAFSVRGLSVELYLNANTDLPTMLRVLRPDPIGVWGEIVERRWFSYWTLEAGGVWFARQITTDRDGVPYSDQTVLRVTLNPPLDEAAFLIPEETRTTFGALATRMAGLVNQRLDEGRSVRLAEDAVLLKGSWNVLLVRQGDGSLVIDAPISSAYSSDVLTAARRQFGGRVKGLVTTSDAWPHIAGVREFVAEGLPVFRLDLNAPILNRLVAASRGMTDRLAERPRNPQWRDISTRTRIGKGPGAVELIPVRGEMGERMLLVWMESRRILYVSDMIQRDRSGGFFLMGGLAEVQAAVRREGLDVETVVAMHLDPTAWAEIERALAALRSP